MLVICCGGSIPPCEHDKREIENLILFKKRLKKHLTKENECGIIIIEKEKVGNENDRNKSISI
jgi:hypothetical protein